MEMSRRNGGESMKGREISVVSFILLIIFSVIAIVTILTLKGELDSFKDPCNNFYLSEQNISFINGTKFVTDGRGGYNCYRAYSRDEVEIYFYPQIGNTFGASDVVYIIHCIKSNNFCDIEEVMEDVKT